MEFNGVTDTTAYTKALLIERQKVINERLTTLCNEECVQQYLALQKEYEVLAESLKDIERPRLPAPPIPGTPLNGERSLLDKGQIIKNMGKYYDEAIYNEVARAIVSGARALSHAHSLPQTEGWEFVSKDLEPITRKYYGGKDYYISNVTHAYVSHLEASGVFVHSSGKRPKLYKLKMTPLPLPGADNPDARRQAFIEERDVEREQLNDVHRGR